MRWEKDLVKVDLPKTNKETTTNEVNVYSEVNNFQYKFVLKPEYSITGVRENSPAYLVDLKKGDKLIEIKEKKTADMTLQQINEIFMSEENKTIKIRIIRNSVTLEKVILLKDPIPYQEN